MKRMDQLMKELGFNKDAAEGSKEAFIKHLVKASLGVNVATPGERREIEKNPDRVRPLVKAKKTVPEQLSFDLDATGTDDAQSD